MVYIFILILLYSLTYKYELKSSLKKKNTQWLPIILIVTILVAGLRDELGADTLNYQSFFSSTPSLFSIKESYYESTRFKPGFVNIVAFCKSIISDFVFLQFIEAIFINTIIIVFFYKYSKFPYLCILLYVLINFLEFNMEIMREAFSIGLVLLAWMYWHKRHHLIALLFFFLATTVHISSFIALTYPIAEKIHFNKKWIFLAIASIVSLPLIFFSIPNLSLVVSILLQSDSESVIGLYTTQEFNDSFTINAYLIHYIQFALVIAAFYILQKKGIEPKYPGYVLIYMILMYLSTISYGFYRFTNYYTLFYIIFLANAIICISKYTKIRRYCTICFAGLLLYITYYHERKLLVEDVDNLNTIYVYERYFPYKSVL